MLASAPWTPAKSSGFSVPPWYGDVNRYKYGTRIGINNPYNSDSNDGPQAIRVDAESSDQDRTQTLELKGLNEGRQYDVWVTASTAVGEGPETKRVTNTPSQRGKNLRR